MSGKQLLEASDVQRRSRHIEIRIEWLRDLMNSGQLSLTFVPGAVNPADMLTKCLPSADQRRYREVLECEVRELTLLSSLAMSGGSRLPLRDASGSVMSLLRERNTCILCGDVLSSFHRPPEVSGAQPCDLSSLRFSCVFVDMSSSSTSEGTKCRRARAAELPTEGIELAVAGEAAPEGAGPSDGPPEGASSSGQPVAESQPQSSGPAVAVPEVPPPLPRMLEGPPMQVGDGLGSSLTRLRLRRLRIGLQWC